MAGFFLATNSSLANFEVDEAEVEDGECQVDVWSDLQVVTSCAVKFISFTAEMDKERFTPTAQAQIFRNEFFAIGASIKFEEQILTRALFTYNVNKDFKVNLNLGYEDGIWWGVGFEWEFADRWKLTGEYAVSQFQVGLRWAPINENVGFTLIYGQLGIDRWIKAGVGVEFKYK